MNDTDPCDDAGYVGSSFYPNRSLGNHLSVCLSVNTNETEWNFLITTTSFQRSMLKCPIRIRRQTKIFYRMTLAECDWHVMTNLEHTGWAID